VPSLEVIFPLKKILFARELSPNIFTLRNQLGGL
jgi:hypothetical protein